MLIRSFGCLSAPLGPSDESLLEEIRFEHVLQGLAVLAQGRGDRLNPNGTTIKFINHEREESPVGAVKAETIDLEQLKRLARGL
jgi:hypothetical protein